MDAEKLTDVVLFAVGMFAGALLVGEAGYETPGQLILMRS